MRWSEVKNVPLLRNILMSDLRQYFEQNTGHLIPKWDHYFEIYERHFSRFRGKQAVVMETTFAVGHSSSTARG